MNTRILALVAVSMAAITVGCKPNATLVEPPASGSTSGERPDAYGPPQPISIPAVAKVCAGSPCSGDGARVQGWLNDRNQIVLLVHQGDPGRCSSPPTAYCAADGRQIDVVETKPVVVGSEEEKRSRQRRDTLIRGLIPGQTVLCRDAH